MTCANGHKVLRCSLTFLPISTQSYSECAICHSLVLKSEGTRLSTLVVSRKIHLVAIILLICSFQVSFDALLATTRCKLHSSNDTVFRWHERRYGRKRFQPLGSQKITRKCTQKFFKFSNFHDFSLYFNNIISDFHKILQTYLKFLII